MSRVSKDFDYSVEDRRLRRVDRKDSFDFHTEFIIRDNQLVYEHYTTMTTDDIRVRDEIEGYIHLEEILMEEHVLMNIGLDGNQVENFLYFPENLSKVEEAKKKEVSAAFHNNIKYNSERRKRSWQIIYFGYEEDRDGPRSHFDLRNLTKEVDSNTHEPFFKGIVHLYASPKMAVYLSSFSDEEDARLIRMYPTVWDYMKSEKLADTRHVQQMLGGLDRQH